MKRNSVEFEIKRKEFVDKSILLSMKYIDEYIKKYLNYDERKMLRYIRKKVDIATKELAIEIMEFMIEHSKSVNKDMNVLNDLISYK
jgi:hypothetical protein